MKLKYGLDETPPLFENILFGLQWLAISVPGIIILGKIVGSLHVSDPYYQIIYLQKMYFVTGITLFCQVMWGHRLPLITGPSTVLLIGVITAGGFSLNAVYGSVALGGALLFLVSVLGVFGHIRKLFTPRVVAAVLLLIAVTLTPAIIRLLTTSDRAATVPVNLSFAMVVICLMFLLYRHLKGIWKSTIIIWSMTGATVLYLLLFPLARGTAKGAPHALVAPFFHGLTSGPDFQPGVIISFLFCFFALSVNDIGSIQSISEMLKPGEPEKRLNKGITVTGLANVLSGILGVIGPVNFSLSPGVIMASGCASRYALVPTAIGLTALAFSPLAMSFMGSVPPVVIGTMLVYILCYQVAAALMVLFEPGKAFPLESGLVIGFPLLLGAIFSFLPEDAIRTFPTLIRPLIGNGFVIGVLASLILEHLIFTKTSATK